LRTLTVGLLGLLLAGDLDGDGKPDLAVVNQDANDVSVLINTTP
jgi:hypothetical protein